ncbi:MAG: alpha/beta fold hydrolase [Myxococcota bacterium]|nr:alpha/beta fold hydrolase [Myxococcota bacterium]
MGIFESAGQRFMHEPRKLLRTPRDQLAGHAWTILPYLTDRISPSRLMFGQAYGYAHHDHRLGPTPIHGTLFTGRMPSRRLVMIQHGIASSRREPYILRLTKHLVARGFHVLSLSLRGSHGHGCDHYHAGLTEDLQAVFSDPALAAYDKIWLIGYSLGGQIALRFALDIAPPRLAGVASVCAPLCMRSAQLALDTPGMRMYRRPILATLKRRYKRLWHNALVQGRPMAGNLKTILGTKTFYEWDESVVCPRFGFRSVGAYYDRVSTRDELGRLAVPTLAIFARHDPIVPFTSVEELTHRPPPSMRVQVLDQAGHLGCIQQLRIGPTESRFDTALLEWLSSQPDQHARSPVQGDHSS